MRLWLTQREREKGRERERVRRLPRAPRMQPSHCRRNPLMKNLLRHLRGLVRPMLMKPAWIAGRKTRSRAAARRRRSREKSKRRGRKEKRLGMSREKSKRRGRKEKRLGMSREKSKR
eukprot:Rmarinus@m.18935